MTTPAEELRIKLESLAVTSYRHGQNGTAYEPEKDIVYILDAILSQQQTLLDKITELETRLKDEG